MPAKASHQVNDGSLSLLRRSLTGEQRRNRSAERGPGSLALSWRRGMGPARSPAWWAWPDRETCRRGRAVAPSRGATGCAGGRARGRAVHRPLSC